MHSWPEQPDFMQSESEEHSFVMFCCELFTGGLLDVHAARITIIAIISKSFFIYFLVAIRFIYSSVLGILCANSS